MRNAIHFDQRLIHTKVINEMIIIGPGCVDKPGECDQFSKFLDEKYLSIDCFLHLFYSTLQLNIFF